MLNVMLDLETLSTTSDAVVLQIGACRFETEGALSDTFERTIDIDSCLKAGLRVDGSTVDWWLRQTEAARLAVTDTRARPLHDALSDFSGWLGVVNFQEPEFLLWSHGASFDVPILESAYRAIGWKAPWNYRAPRDTRTLFQLAGELAGWDRPYRETAHTALADAVAQAEDVQSAYAALRELKEDLEAYEKALSAAEDRYC
jgi:hypothetical protein